MIFSFEKRINASVMILLCFFSLEVVGVYSYSIAVIQARASVLQLNTAATTYM